MLNEQAWIEYLNRDDPAIRETLRLFREGNAFPQPAPVAEQGQKVAFMVK
jgi:carboxyl-terminal processing protease